MTINRKRVLKSVKDLERLSELAESGCSTAMLRLGKLYDRGYKIQGDDCGTTHVNMAEGYRYYRMAYENGEMEAAFYLGLHYLVGAAVEKDLSVARRYLHEALSSPNQIISNAAKEVAIKNGIKL